MYQLLLGEVKDRLKELPDNSIDSIVTDPPYELGFMGKSWDSTGIAYDVEMWRECLRVLKPGGHLLSFGGSRTYHRMACAVEDAGFEIRDQVMWVYSQGFPKSLDVSKAIDKAAGAERVVLGEGTPMKRMIPGADQDATGSWIKDNGRVYIPTVTAPATEDAVKWDGWGTALKPAHESIALARKPMIGTVATNVIAHGTGAINIRDSRIPGEPTPINKLEKWSGFGEEKRPAYVGTVNNEGRWPANVMHDGLDEPWAKFFYCAKANKQDRGEGNDHATVKPNALMRYLVKLITPPGGVVLDQFCGSGSTGRAAVQEGFQFIGIDNDAHHIEIAARRIEEVEDVNNRSTNTSTTSNDSDSTPGDAQFLPETREANPDPHGCFGDMFSREQMAV